MAKPIQVTQPYLPPLDELYPLLEEIWATRVLTNGGPFHQRLEAALCEYLGVEHLALFTNATVALVTALQSLEISGEVITTPYSFVATAHSLLWNRITPVFVDVKGDTLNINPDLIEAAITPTTTAILPVHCYGHPCDVDAIEAIASAHRLKVIYDAAHAFGVRTGSGRLLQRGDLSVLSFHATKVFNTFEGGAIICPDAAAKRRIDFLKNFGFSGETTVVAPGINGKMSEFPAALGLLQLAHIDEAIERRAAIDALYRRLLTALPGVSCHPPSTAARHNFSYFPVFFDGAAGGTRDGLYEHLRSHQIFGRRYFYPLITEFPMYRSLPSAARHLLPVAAGASDRVICLPIHPALSDDDVVEVSDCVRGYVLRPI